MVDVWIPPGTWYDYFTGEALTGPATISRDVPLERYPVFLRAGAILPTQAPLPYTPAEPLDELIVTTWPGDGEFSLYDDAGRGLEYLDGAFGWTPMHSQTSEDGCRMLTIDAMTGSFAQAPSQRRWTIRFVELSQPAVVKLNGQAISASGDQSSWSYDAASATLRIETGPQSTGSGLIVEAGGAGC